MPGVPTHGPDCETRTWPTGCPTCGQQVFYFSCTCGSGVFFDALGPPWPIHRDAGDADTGGDAWPDWLNNVQLSVADDGSVVAQLPDLGVSIVRPGDAAAAGAAAPAARSRRRRNRRPRRPRTDPIVAVPPDLSATREFTGTLNEIIPIINLTALGYADDGPMAAALAKAMLGRRWADRFGRITVYTRQPGAEQQESYTALIPAGLISDRRSVKRGIAVAVKLTGIDVSDRRRDWYCDDFRVVE